MKNLKINKLLFLLLTLGLPSTSFAQLYLDFMHDGLERDYILYLPDNLPEGSPLVFVLHGYSGTANGTMNYCGMNEQADENKFAVCYPYGTRDQWENRFWHVGYEFHSSETVDDVGFIVALANYLQTNHNLSSLHTFCTGMSNGGDMSYMLACQASETFLAVAPVAGCMMEWIYNSCQPDNVIPLLEIHGTNDDVTWWNGDPDNEGGWGAYKSVPDAIELWKDLNNTTEFELEYLPDLDPDDGSYVKAEKYTQGDNNNEVWLYRVVDGGHDWPGSWGNMDIDSSDEIWNFFVNAIENNPQGVNERKQKSVVEVHKIFPNPFQTKTTISYELHDRSHVQISIYDLYGKKIDTLVNQMQQPGRKTVIWDTQDLNLHSELFLCRIQAGSFTTVELLVLKKQ